MDGAADKAEDQVAPASVGAAGDRLPESLYFWFLFCDISHMDAA